MEITFFTFQAYVSHTTLIPLSWIILTKKGFMTDFSHVRIIFTLVNTPWETRVLWIFFVARKMSVMYKLEWISVDVILPLGIFISVASEKLSWWGSGKLFVLD